MITLEHRLRFEKLSRILDQIIEKYREKPMVEELTVREISEALGYEVKVVKEQEKSKLKHGDIVRAADGFTRIILRYKGNLVGFNETDNFNDAGFDFDGWAKQCGYVKIGNVFKN